MLRLNLLARSMRSMPSMRSMRPPVPPATVPTPRAAPTSLTLAPRLQQSRSLVSSARAGRAPVPNSPTSPLVPKGQQPSSRPPAQKQHQFWYREVFPCECVPWFALVRPSPRLSRSPSLSRSDFSRYRRYAQIGHNAVFF